MHSQVNCPHLPSLLWGSREGVPGFLLPEIWAGRTGWVGRTKPEGGLDAGPGQVFLKSICPGLEELGSCKQYTGKGQPPPEVGGRVLKLG